MRPEAFQGLKSNFEILAKMQHFGLPTRLLDFTLNPLIALYSACSESPSKDARVLCSSTVFTDNQSGIINSICSSFKMFSLMNVSLEDFVADKNLTAYQYIARLYLRKDFRLLFVKPQYWNQRIVNQSAIFLVFHNVLFDHLGKKTYYKERFVDNIERQLQIDEIAKRENLNHIYPLWTPCNQQHIELKNMAENLYGNDLPIKRDFFCRL